MGTNSADQPEWSSLIGELVRLIAAVTRSRLIGELVNLRQDPKIVRLALRLAAGYPELAEDGLQETFYLLATIRDPGRILNLRAYFCTTLYHAINSQRTQIVLVDPDVLGRQIDPWNVLGPQAQDVPELAHWHILCAKRQSKFRRIRGEMLAVTPASSPDPARYRALILAIVENLLAEAFYGCTSRAELNADLCDGYPEWFNDSGVLAPTRYKRLSRARHDLKVVLTTIDADWEVTL